MSGHVRQVSNRVMGFATAGVYLPLLLLLAPIPHARKYAG